MKEDLKTVVVHLFGWMVRGEEGKKKIVHNDRPFLFVILSLSHFLFLYYAK